MATVGDVILSDGKFAKASSTETKVAMVAYVGSETDHGYFHGLAIAMTDESDKMDWETAKNTCKNKPVPFSPSEWVLPSKNQWETMFQANGGDHHKYSGLKTALETAGGDQLTMYTYYWTSSEGVLNVLCLEVIYDTATKEGISFKEISYNDHYVRACLAF